MLPERWETNAITVFIFSIFVLWLDTRSIKEKLSAATEITGERKPRCLGGLLTNPESYVAEQSPQHKAARKGRATSARRKMCS